MTERLLLIGLGIFAALAVICGVLGIWTADDRWGNTAAIMVGVTIAFIVVVGARKIWDNL